MADIAELGFKADTSDLDKATVTLTKLRDAASGVSQGSKEAARAIISASVNISAAKVEEAKAVYNAARAASNSTKENINAARESLRLAQAELSRVKSVEKAAKANSILEMAEAKLTREKTLAIQAEAELSAQRLRGIQALNAYRKAIISPNKSTLEIIRQSTGLERGMPKWGAESAEIFAESFAEKTLAMKSTFQNAANAVTIGSVRSVVANKQTSLIPRDQMPNRFNTGNIAAQFQDIAVSAQMGVNPLLVAMQQGTQLAAIMNSMQNPLRGMAEAFKQVINPVSLLSIGITALVVAGLQMVDWVSVGKSALNGLADIVQKLGPIFLAAGAAMLVAFAPSILAGIWAISAAFVRLGVVALISGAKMAAAWAMANPITAFLTIITAVGVLSMVFKDTTNQIVGFFVGMWDSVVLASKKSINTLINLWNDSVGKMNNKLIIQPIQMDSRSIEQVFQQAMGKDYIGPVADRVRGALQKLSDTAANRLRSLASSIGQKEGEKDPWTQLVEGAERKIASLKAQSEALNLTGVAALKVKHETDLLNEAQQKGIKLTPEYKNKIDELSTAMANLEYQVKQAKAWKEFTEATDKKISGLEAERKAMSLVGVAAAEFKYKTELMNDAVQKGIDLTPVELEYMNQKAQRLAQISVANDNYRQSLELSKSVSKGFITDMVNGLAQGKSAWQSFGNAVVNVLNKIFDKLIETGINNMFGSSSSNFLTSLVGGLLGGGSNTTNPTFSTGSSVSYAPGNTVTYSAKGNVFSNGVYDSPTMFKFAKGGSFGVMGEAGPEAVMPLKRGSDGSLGVAVNDSVNNGNGVVVNIYNNSNANATVNQRMTSQGIQLDVLIDNIVSEKLSTQGSATNSALTTYQNRKLIAR